MGDGPKTFVYDRFTGAIAPPAHVVRIIDRRNLGWSIETEASDYLNIMSESGSGSEDVLLIPDSLAISMLPPGTHYTPLILSGTTTFCSSDTFWIALTIPDYDERSPYMRTFAGKSHIFMIDPLGILYTSGDNSSGVLGLMDTTDRLAPTPIPGLTGIKAAAAGVHHSMALSSTGDVWAWGDNTRGQLAVDAGILPMRTGLVDSISMELVVEPIPSVPAARKIGAGDDFSALLSEDGTVWTWGNNDDGQLGNGSRTSRHTPLPVSGVSFKDIAVGYRHVVGLYEGDEGIVKTWGDNSSGQIGDGTTEDATSPYHIPDLYNVIAVSAGELHTVAVTADGIVYAWGENSSGQLGLMDTTDRLAPTPIPGLIADRADIRNISTGANHTLALGEDGRLWAWGDNTFGQLGIGLFGSYSIRPQRVMSGDGGYLENIVAISAGNGFSLALTVDGALYAWGANDRGQLGSGTNVDQASPHNSLSPVWSIEEKASALPQKIFMPSVSPNPFNGAVSIEVPRNSVIEIYDIDGKLVHKAHSVSENYTWKPENLPSGVYMIDVTTWGIRSQVRATYLK